MSLLKFVLLVVVALGIEGQHPPPYDTQGLPGQPGGPPPYERDGQPGSPSQPYDRQGQPYDRQNQYDRPRSQYDRPISPYDQDYNRQNQSNYGQNYGGNQSQYGNRSHYGSQGPPYDRDQPYDRNRDQYYIGNRDQPYDRNRDQPYDRNRDHPYDPNRDPYDKNRDQYDRNRDQYDRNRDQQYGNNQSYDRNRDPYGSSQPYDRNRDQPYDRNRDQFDRNRNPYDRNRDQYDRNRDQQFGSDYGGQQYGSPLDSNDNCCRDYCYSEDREPYVNFATKTAYEVSHGNQNNQQSKIPDCTPIQFWSINRHGTRYPGARTISRLRQLTRIHTDIIRNYEDRRSYPDKGRLCASDLELFKRWRWNETITEQRANSLTSQGIMDLKFLARRYATRFGELLREPYSEQVYTFQYTDTDRTHDSYQAYIEGLFQQNAFQVHANVFNNERLIKPSSSCNAWIRRVDQNPDTAFEYMRFKQKQEYQQMVRDVFRRLGFRYTLNDSVIEDMYDMCRYEKAWELNRPSPWCMVFNRDQLKLLEYAEDLKYYYKSGYGNAINQQIGCPPVKDLYEKFERTVNGNGNGNKVSVYFTHSVTIQTFLTAMGIAKDYQPLTADNYFQQHNRKWRTSTIDPFASNLAATLYECRTGERHRVMFFLNEVPVNYPDCSVGLCNWSTVRAKLQSVAGNCNLDFCDQSAASGLHVHHFMYFITLMLTVLFVVRR